MYKILRMVCAIIAAACAAASIFLAIYFGTVAFMGCLAGGLLFFAFCLFFKFMQEEAESKKKTPPADGTAAASESSREKVSDAAPSVRPAAPGGDAEAEKALPGDEPSADKRD